MIEEIKKLCEKKITMFYHGMTSIETMVFAKSILMLIEDYEKKGANK